MPRNSSGTYSLYTPGNPVVTNTVISSTWANNTLADLASALTDSLSRTGDGGMQAPLELDNGAIGAPGLTWAAEPTSGLYRNAAGDFRYSISAADVWRWTATGMVAGAATGGPQGAGTINATAFYDDGVQITGANPTGTIGLTAVNGTAVTYMRSDGAPALSQAIVPTWTGVHTFANAAGTFNTNTNPSYYWNDTDSSSDAKIWRFNAVTDSLVLSTRTDANGGGQNVLSFARSGTTVGLMAFGNATANNAFSFLGTGVVTSGGVHRGPDGSTSAPTYSFTGDTNTGFYTPSAASDDIWMSLGGTGYPVGYRGMPSRTTSGNDSTAATDNGRSVTYTGAGGHTFTIDSDFGTASNIMVLINSGSASLAIAESLSGTLSWFNGSGSISTGARTLAVGGVATIWMLDANNAYIWGVGLT